MKKLLVTASALMVTIGCLQAQGTVNFSNFAPGAGIDAPVFAADGSTRLAGDQFQAQLFAGAAGSAEGDLSAVGAAAPFRTDAGAGYWNAGAGGGNAVRAIGSVTPGDPAAVQVRAWDTSVASTYADAVAAGSGYGASGILEVTTGGAGSPPSVPGNLEGLQSFSLVPEPSIFALGLLGAGALFLRRRAK